MAAGDAVGFSSGDRMSIAIAGCNFVADLHDPDALLTRYHSLTGWAGALLEAGADAVTVVQRFERDITLRRNGVDYHFVADGARASAPPWFLGKRMALAIRALGPEVVHVDGLVFPLFVRHLRSMLPRGTVILVQDHGGMGEGSHPLPSWKWRVLHRFGLGAADGFLFTAPELAAPWRRAGVIVQRHTIYQVPESSTDLPSLPFPAEDQHRLPGRPALLWVGRLDANKDPLTVLAGFEQALVDLPDAVLTLVFGEDRMLPEVRSRIVASPLLRPRVHLRGRMERRALAVLYAGADLFVLGSHHEVACFALIEALSFGVTPLVTNIPPFGALTDGGRLGALFPPGDGSAFARALGRLGGEDFVDRRQGVLAHFARELSWSAVGRKALAIYRSAAASRQQVSPGSP